MQSTRRAAAKYRYSSASASASIEVNCLLTPDELKDRLLLVSCVTGVAPHRKGSKASQGNHGDHWQETNWAVSVKGCKKTLEFEVTKNDHLSAIATKGIPLTRTVMFKDPTKDMRKLAWHILMQSVGDIAMFPVHILSWYSDLFDDIKWDPYQKEDGELWWYQELLPSDSIVRSSTEWHVYSSSDNGRLWAQHDSSGYWSFVS